MCSNTGQVISDLYLLLCQRAAFNLDYRRYIGGWKAFVLTESHVYHSSFIFMGVPGSDLGSYSESFSTSPQSL
jgi:hypothetical protein